MPVSLHTHSWYSLLEAVPSPEALLVQAAACGYTALALTDTNNLYGAVAFTELARRQGIRPLLGACLRQQRAHCVALIADNTGYRSLCRILSRFHLAGADTMLAQLVAENADGLHVLVEDMVLAERLRDALGNRLWLEVVRPNRAARQEQELLAAGRRLGLRPVASTAAHLATPADYPLFRVLGAVRQGTLVDQLPVRTLITADHHLVDAKTLRHRFHDLPEAVRNTDLLAGQLRSDVLPRDTILPPPRVPRALDGVRYLRLLCERGLRRRELAMDLSAQRRLREELRVIETGGLSDYFLVARDIARYARGKGYSMALRGSAGNCLVCYLLEITNVDPLRFDLPLERFLHPGRPDLPDIDLDFDWKVRDDVIAHVFHRYGAQHVAMISTHLFLQPRSAFREACKAHGLANEQISRLVETLPERVESLLEEVSRSHALRGNARPDALRHETGGDLTQSVNTCVPTQSVGTRVSRVSVPPGFPLEPERWPRILRDAGLLLGRPHHLSVHPGGVVITPRPIEDYVPLQRAAKGVVVTQFEKDAVEHIGLVKMDLLGNRALSTVDEAIRIADCRPQVSAPASSPSTIGNRQSAICNLSDPATLALIQRGDTLGVNQLESPAMRHLLVQMQPRGVEDVIHSLALIRPGAGSAGMKGRFVQRRRGLEPMGNLPPALATLLRETHGVLLYQDDAFELVRALTGLSVLEADHFFKRVTKQRTEEDGRQLETEFLQACAAHGTPPAVAVEQWAQLARFQYYTFCKSHAVSYGLIAWQAAYLKAHAPLAFWAAALNNNQGVYPRRVYIEAIKRAGVGLRLPCINRSAGPFLPERGAIRVGLDAVATLAEGVRTCMLAERERHGPYRDLADFRRRIAPGPETLAALIRCGALDFTGRPRPALFLEAELADRDPRPDDPSLFPDPCPLLADSGEWTPADYPVRRRLRDEWALLGFVVGPPLLTLFRSRLPDDLIASAELPAHVGRVVRVAGVVATARYTQTVNGRDMQFVTLEDAQGLMEVTLFPGTCPLVTHLQLGPYVVTGLVEDQLGVLTVTARRFERLLDV